MDHHSAMHAEHITAPAGWIWLVVGFVYLGGIANGMLAWAAIFRVAQSRWTPAVSRVCHAALAFVPVQAVVLVILFVGIGSYVPWVAHPLPAKAAWLNVPFMIVRNLVLLGAFWGLSFLMVRWSLEADAKRSRGEGVAPHDHHRLNAIAVGVVFAYAAAMTVVSYDFVMSLSPEWYSTMFAPYYFCTSLYAALAVIVLIMTRMRENGHARRHLGPQHFQDVGNLMLAFSLFNMGLFFAQYLTIWYGNLPEETFFLLARYAHAPWAPLGWAAFVVGYAIPFVLLQSRYLKRNPRLASMAAVVLLLGVGMERYVLVGPSIEPGPLAAGWAATLIVAVLAALFAPATAAFLIRYPAVSSADEALREMERTDTAL